MTRHRRTTYTVGLTQMQDDRYGPDTQPVLVHAIGRVRLYKRYTKLRQTTVWEVGLLSPARREITLPYNAISAQIALRLARPYLPKLEPPQTNLIGFRSWQLSLRPDGPILLSINAGSDMERGRWEGPVMVADMLPELNNSSGLYCAKAQNHRDLTAGYGGPNTIQGFVQLFGQVVEHTAGYRAEKMLVKALYSPTRLWLPVKNALADRYQCEVACGNR